MTAFTELERSAMLAIFAELPKLAADLKQQLTLATVTSRKNTGVGFFTNMHVADDAPRVHCDNPLNTDIHARIDGRQSDMGFLVWMEDGRIGTLEGYTYADSTEGLDLAALKFELYKAQVTRT